MKKKLLLTLAIVMVVALALAITAFADSIHNENTVNYSEKVTLSDGTVLPIFDENKEALIWYISGTDGEGNNVYTSIRSDDPQVIYHCESWFEITSTRIDLSDGTTINSSNFVVVNWMDDDVVVNECTNANFIGKGVTGFKLMFQGHTKLEYIYLRHDTTSIMRQNFNGCSNLRYINFKDLSNVTRIGDSQNFSNCAQLFKGQILDLTAMVKLEKIDGGGSFNGTQIKGIKLPSSIKTISSWTFQATAIESIAWPKTVTAMEGSMFKNNTALKEIYLSNTLTSIGGDAFLNVNTLEKIFFVGTEDELNTLITNTSTTGNSTFLAVAENIISYEDYLKLEDKSGKYAVYNYSNCEAYKDGEHTPNPEVTDCTKGVNCTECIAIIEKGYEGHEIVHTLTFPQGFDKAGVLNHKCSRDYCTVAIDLDDDGVADEQIIDEATDPIITFKGYSTPETGNVKGINAGFKVEKDLLTLYNDLNEVDATLTIFMVNSKSNDVNISKILDGDTLELADGVKGINVKITSVNYTSISVEVRGFDDSEGGNFYTLNLITAIAVKTADGVHYVQAGLKNSPNTTQTVDGVDFNIVTANKIYNPAS